MVDMPAAFHALPRGELALPRVKPSDISYIQYTSGSTRFPRGVVIKRTKPRWPTCGHHRPRPEDER